MDRPELVDRPLLVGRLGPAEPRSGDVVEALLEVGSTIFEVDSRPVVVLDERPNRAARDARAVVSSSRWTTPTDVSKVAFVRAVTVTTGSNSRVASGSGIDAGSRLATSAIASTRGALEPFVGWMGRNPSSQRISIRPL
ncbi:hypothetical protein EA472_05130 [Natrarchaeobius oligotrophus]|uniref:Uncharacterized protein n=1 Tax=Natrarchaeobius chitinivorans TaxID=1679083 RepID=A0A3N6MYY2_NATCH|nr:hypothetical protein EA472_05130 [Natrarchaeobius chitinivorans]